ncbi:MAG: pilin [Pseudomonadota bacterium]
MLRASILTILAFFTCVVAKADNSGFQGAALIDQLPESTLIYARMPHPTGLLATSKGNGLDPVLGNPDRAQLAQEIIAGAFARLGSLDPETAQPLVDLLNTIQSPLEFAVVATPGPIGVFSMAIGEDTDYEQWFGQLSLLQPGLSTTLVSEPQSIYAVDGMPTPVFATHDAAAGRVSFFLGQQLDTDGVERALGMMDSNGGIAGEVASIDTSGQGMVVWANVERALPMAQLFVPAEQYSQMQEFGIETVRSLQFGIGVAEGRSRIGFHANLLADAESKLPIVEHALEARAAGQLDSVFQLTFPSPQDVERLAALLEDNIDADEWVDYQYLMARLADAYAVDFDLWARAFGPDVTFMVDSASEYLAIRIRDAGAYKEWLARVDSATHLDYDKKKVGRQTIHRLIRRDLEEVSASDIETEDGEPFAQLVGLLNDVKDYYYWVEEDGYLYLDFVPQGLMSRAKERKRVEVGTWLEDEQRVDLSNAILGASWNSRHLPRRLYHTYLTVLQLAADVGGTPFDVFEMPTAQALRLPEQSSMSMSFNFGPDTVGFELMSESSPFDLLLAGNATTSAAVAGILAAIAIPAYQDYTIRVEVSEGLSRAAMLKTPIVDYYEVNGTMPDRDAAIEIVESSGHDYVRIVPGAGIIEIGYDPMTASEPLTVGLLYIEPFIDESGDITWQCSSTIERKYLPSDCRDNPLPEGY